MSDDDEEKWLFRLGVDSDEEIIRALGWDRPDIPRCVCGLPLPEVGTFCGAESCRYQLQAPR